MAANSEEILHDFPPILRVYKDGRVERLISQEFVPPSLDPAATVHSKDVVISPETGLSARIFRPAGDTDPKLRRPLVVYFHGSGFVVESAFSPLYHKHLSRLVAQAKVVAVSVNYRLAPEHPLPIAYEDSWQALKWVASQSSEDWIKEHADLDRVFIGGDSAGGNIAHNMAIRVGSGHLEGGISVRGVFLNCPFFYGKDPIGDEETYGGFPSKSYVDRLWRFVCPGTTGSDDPLINPGSDPNLWRLGCKRLLVYGAEKDHWRHRIWYYKEALKKSGWDGEIEVVEVEGEEHCFSVADPDSENGIAMLQNLASFINHN